MKKNNHPSYDGATDEIEKLLTQLEGMVYFLTQYDQNDFIPSNSNMLFWGFGSVMEEKIQLIRKLIDQINNTKG